MRDTTKGAAPVAMTGMLAGILAALSVSALAADGEYDLLAADQASIGVQVCATCHGAYGRGNPVVGGPSLAGLEPWYLRRQLQGFRAGHRGTQPRYVPGYEMRQSVDGISAAEIDELVAEIAAWPQVAPAPTVAGDAEAGRQLYAACAACHGADGAGNEALGAPGLAGRDDWYLARQLKLFRSGYRGSHPDDTFGRQMRPFAMALPDDRQINDLLAYINSL